MTGRSAEDYEKKIQSLTENLLECYEELDLVFRLSRGLMSTLDVQRSVELVLDEALEIFEGDMGCVVPVGADAFSAVHRNIPDELGGFLQDRVVGPLLAEERSRALHGLRGQLGTDRTDIPDSLMGTLLKTETRTYGILCVGRCDPTRLFTSGDTKLAGVLASQAAIALENERLNRQRLLERDHRIRMQEEVRLARVIQENLLPKTMPALAGYDVSGRSLPASIVGGDYFDLIPMAGGRLGVCLGDVSGKGMPAALIMSNLQAAVRGQTLLEASPSTCLSHSNTLLFRSTEIDKFATCFYGILDASEHCLRYTNAGHDTPILVSPQGSFTPLDVGGLILGITEHHPFEEAAVPVEPGALLVLYSDGITETRNGTGEEFGEERLRDLVIANRSLPATGLIDRILSDVTAFGADPEAADDRTLVVIRREG